MKCMKCATIIPLLAILGIFTSVRAVDWHETRFYISETSARMGWSVNSAGDVNDDGYDDFIVGIPWDDNNGHADAGMAVVYLGGPIFDYAPDVFMYGDSAGDLFGYSVSGAGDVNGDGYDDVVVGAPRSHYGATDGGAAYVFFGGNPMNGTYEGFVYSNNAGDSLGFSVSGAGDINGDGYDDLVVGWPFVDNGADVNTGEAIVFFGGATFTLTGDVYLLGEAAGDRFGYSVASAGDVNGDGLADIIIGAPYNSSAGIYWGRAYIYFGSYAFNNVVDVTLSGTSAENLGFSVHTAGTVNGDVYDDVIVSAPGNDVNGTNAGAAYIYFGGTAMNSTADYTLLGDKSADYFGYAVGGGGSVNGDIYGDVIVGAYASDFPGNTAGNVCLFFGGSSVNTGADKYFYGNESSDNFGWSVAMAGDINMDGYSDILVGAPLYNANNYGQVTVARPYLFEITSPNGGETWNVGTEQAIRWRGVESADAFLSVDGGATYPYQIASNIGGEDTNTFIFQVPHTPSKFCKIMVVKYNTPSGYPKNFSVSDSFFTIQSTIALLNFVANPNPIGGVSLSWQTEPGVPDIKGYNVYCRCGSIEEPEKINNDLVTNSQYHDPVTRGGMATYQLGAVNGLGQEYIVGEVTCCGTEKPLAMVPSIMNQAGMVTFWFAQAFPGEAETDIEIAVYDVIGKKVRTLINQKMVPGFHSCGFDGKDEKGNAIPAGTYFLIMKTPKCTERTKFIKPW